ncbi:MAG: chaperone modulator CbpM [Rhodospirillaceae bacterium]
MITVDILVAQLPGLSRQDLERWIANEWVRPDSRLGHYTFQEIDVARVRLIRELRDDLQINEEALPVVLSLLDQLYALRRRVKLFGDVVGAMPKDFRDTLAARLRSDGN